MCMELSLAWGGRLHRVPVVAACCDNQRMAWTYAQHIVAGASEVDALQSAFAVGYPGLGFANIPRAQPLPFGHAVFGLRDDGPFDTSSHASRLNSRSQMRPPHASSRPNTNVARDSGDHGKQRPQFATSNGGRPRDQHVTGDGRHYEQRGPKRDANSHKAGWQGSDATNAPSRAGARTA